MTSARINEIWKGMGKIVKLSQLGAVQASGVKDHLFATVKQFGQQAGGADYYDDLIQVVVPLETKMQPTVSALDRVPAQAKATMEAYLRTIASELSQPNTATITAILDSLRAQMQANSLTISPSGGSFWMYFKENFGFSTFPTSGAANIPESWVTTTIV